MKRLAIYNLLLIAFFMSGCVMRTNSYEVDRVDQEIKGNRGVLMGSVPSVSQKQAKKTRKMYNLEIELPSSLDLKSSKEDLALQNTASQATVSQVNASQTRILQGNRGYMQKKQIPEKKGSSILKPYAVPNMPQILYQTSAEPKNKIKEEKKEKIYVVEEKDTLQKISDKMYGTTKKWKQIYEANKDVLETPDVIRPGQKLVIPTE